MIRLLAALFICGWSLTDVQANNPFGLERDGHCESMSGSTFCDAAVANNPKLCFKQNFRLKCQVECRDCECKDTRPSTTGTCKSSKCATASAKYVRKCLSTCDKCCTRNCPENDVCANVYPDAYCDTLTSEQCNEKPFKYRCQKKCRNFECEDTRGGNCVNNCDSKSIQYRSKCLKSCGLCCKASDFPTTTAAPPFTGSTTMGPTPGPLTCGASLRLIVNPHDHKIVGGTEATYGHWPWIANVEDFQPNNNYYSCGGTIIDTCWVLTAAHCIVVGNNVDVVVGNHLQDTTDASEMRIGVSEIFVHPDYDSSSSDSDIALLKLSTCLTYNDYVQPICLQTPSDSIPSTLEIAGWGRTGSNKPSSNVLLETAVPAVSQSDCRDSYGISTITDNMICAGEGGKDTCQGDSGGPLVYTAANGAITQVGITSFGIGCALENFPGVYTRVSRFVDWIEDTKTSNP